MAEIQTILSIRESRDKIREKIKSINYKAFKEQTFGSENEYTYRGMIGGIESLLTDISTLTQYKNKFIKLSSYSERKNISTDLKNVLAHLNNPNNLWSHVESLKKRLRAFNVRSLSENFIEFEKEIDEVWKIKLEVIEAFQEIKEIKSNVEKKNNEILELNSKSEEKQIKIENQIDSLNEKLNTLKRESDELSELNDSLVSVKNEAEKTNDIISEIRIEAESNKKLIESFTITIQDRETRLGTLEQQIEINDEKLSEYEKEREDILKKANELIEDAKKALEYKTAEGLSASFSSQYNKSSNRWVLGAWIVGSLVFLLISLCYGTYIIANVSSEIVDPETGLTQVTTNSWYLVLSRILLLPLPITASIFCANQYSKQKQILEDYAYKMTIAKSIVGFSEQLKKNKSGEDNTEYIKYIEKALGEIHKDPLRSRANKKEEELSVSQLEQFIPLMKSFIETYKSTLNKEGL